MFLNYVFADVVELFCFYLIHTDRRKLHLSDTKDRLQIGRVQNAGNSNSRWATASGIEFSESHVFFLTAMTVNVIVKQRLNVIASSKKLTCGCAPRDIKAIVFYCWTIVADDGPTVKQHLLNF